MPKPFYHARRWTGMSMLLAIAAIVASVLAAVVALVTGGPVAIAAGVVALGAAVVLFLERRMETNVGAAVVGLLAIAGILGAVGSVGGKDGGMNFGISATMGSALVIAALLAVPAIACWSRKDTLPGWAVWGTMAIAVLAAFLAFIQNGDLGATAEPMVLFIAVLCLMTAVGGVMLLRSGSNAPAAVYHTSTAAAEPAPVKPATTTKAKPKKSAKK